MLVLSRKSQQSVVVGGSAGFKHLLKVTVLEVNDGKVKLGFDVDKEVPVHRWEVWKKIQTDSAVVSQTQRPGPPVEKWDSNKSLPRGRGQYPSIHSGDSVSGGTGKHGILVVDDDQSVQSVLNASLRNQGFAVWLAADGQEALNLYQRHSKAIDVVLLDLHMPGLDGPSTLTALREINPAIRSCYMSADSDAKAIVGCAAVIRKPFNLIEVAQLLRKLAGNPNGKPASL